MGTKLASEIIARARHIFQDDTGTRWTNAEELNWLNDGQREIVLLRPEASVINETMALVAGTKQTIPALGIKLIDAVRNMTGIGNATPSKVVRIINREVLDSTIPTWHSDPANATGEVDHYLFDHRDPKVFYVYPQPPATPSGIEIIYSSSPADVAATTNAITLDDVYANALLDYMLYRSYLKDADFSGNVNRATLHKNAFMQSLGLKAQSDIETDPNAA